VRMSVSNTTRRELNLVGLKGLNDDSLVGNLADQVRCSSLY